MFRKFRVFYIIAAVIMLVCNGCESKDENVVLEDTRGIDGFGDYGTFNDNGVFYTRKGIVYMFDPETGIKAPLCSKANCDHRGKAPDNPHPSCDAYFGQAVAYSAIIGGKLYYMVTVPDDDSKEGSLFIKEMYVSDVNGTQRKLLFSADDIEFSCIGRYENGYFLYGYYNSEDVTGEKLENDRSGMIVLDLKTEAIKRIDIDNGYGCHVWAMTIRDGCLYYGISYTAEDLSGYDYGDLTDADLADKLSRSMKNEIWRYNLEDESSELLFEVSGWLPRLALSYAHLYYSYDNKEHIVRNLEDGKECRLQREDVYMSPFMYSDGIVFTDNGEIEIWRYGTETAEKIGDFIPDGDISIVWITEKWVYADVFNSKEGYKMVYCSREKFMKGDFEWHEYNIK